MYVCAGFVGKPQGGCNGSVQEHINESIRQSRSLWVLKFSSCYQRPYGTENFCVILASKASFYVSDVIYC